jgi:Asp-tRNA(Asn)/Glu-tRNA(Gln) amidotransferase A subunit family amidase
MSSNLYKLTATEILAKIKAGEVSVEEYARSLDAIPQLERGPLHGIAIAVKDVIYTKGGCVKS